MVSKLWNNYNSKQAYDGYFTKDNKLRKHATIISSILERYGKKKLQEIEKNCQRSKDVAISRGQFGRSTGGYGRWRRTESD